MTATTALDPLISEFDTKEQEEAHRAWIKAELTRRMAKGGKPIPHDEVMRRMDERIAYCQCTGRTVARGKKSVMADSGNAIKP